MADYRHVRLDKASSPKEIDQRYSHPVKNQSKLLKVL